MASRADLIEEILTANGGRMRVAEITRALAARENSDTGLLRRNAAVPATVRQDNSTRIKRGQAKRFRSYESSGQGDEERGFVSLVRIQGQISSDGEIGIPEQIQNANLQVREELRKYIAAMSWQDFESAFLSQFLEALGFQEIVITQPTRDGGKDAECTYKVGLVTHEAVVSAKHWNTQTVGLNEVQRVRGISSNADTGIIFTSSKFTEPAIAEAQERKFGQRSIVLIDGNQIVETCVREALGVEPVQLPTLFRFTGIARSDEEELDLEE